MSTERSRSIIDISVPVGAGLPIWPGDPPFELTRYSSMADGAAANVSKVSCSVHVGTHVDAPLHFIADGAPTERLPLDVLVGPAWVVDVRELTAIGPADLDAASIPEGATRILLKTSNSDLWDDPDRGFVEDYVALTPTAARWVVDRGIRLIGVDYLSVQRFSDPDPATHRILLEAGMVIIEGLDLKGVAAGEYELVCLPWKLEGADGAPARAVLLSRDSTSNDGRE